MVELKIKAIKSRVLCVRMKLLHRPIRSQQERSFFQAYHKWILLFSFSLYFFASYLIGSDPQTPATSLRTNHFSKPESTRFSRALFESSHLAPHKPQISPGVLKTLKVFVYDLPPKYNTNWLSNERCGSHLFASEVAIHRALLTSNVRTFDPHEADFFFVPVYVSCNFSTVNGFPAIGHARSLIASAVKFITSEHQFWNRSSGSDHVFVASHDFGACFHTLEDAAIADGIPEILKNSVILQTFGVQYKHQCQDVENVVIPPYVSPESLQTTLEKTPVDGKRDIWAFFRGKMEVHPKNVSGRFYSKRVRTAIWRRYSGDRRFYLRRHRFEGYQSEIARSVFCLCPLGWAPWSPRLVESVALGCVPVIIADGIQLPFSGAVRWEEISVRVAEKDVGRLGEILEEMAATNLSSIQRKLWGPSTKRALMYNSEVEEGDATWQVLEALREKRDRRWRVSGQWESDR